ncbi:MAG: virulence RhuM family protein [Candidatus Saccharibacteria bacterium]|nr:virulence RhuM family protein [Candidatus Saccharibacteria bacterium]
MSEEELKKSDFLLYTTPDGSVKIEVFFENETVWLTQAKMSELFNVDRTVITKHIANIFESGELEESSNVQKLHVANSTKPVSYYNLDVIISVGYRVNSIQATQFRIWATKTLRNFIIKGFALDEDRLKNGSHFGKDYFDELLEKIREIRASERRFYQKITDIYATSIDYNKEAEITKEFFATVQNKLHFAIHGQTAAELIANSADAKKPHMGLKTWKNSPKGKVLKSDTTVGKNYLGEKQLKELNRIVGMYLDFAENQAERQVAMKMTDWVEKLDAFLKFNEYELLNSPGKVSKAAAEKLAHKEYKKFHPVQDKQFVSDFDEEVKKIQSKRSSA